MLRPVRVLCGSQVWFIHTHASWARYLLEAFHGPASQDSIFSCFELCWFVTFDFAGKPTNVPIEKLVDQVVKDVKVRLPSTVSAAL